MSEPKWTPGPWRIFSIPTRGSWLMAGEVTIAELLAPRAGPCAEESEANDRLMAAATELYDALVQCETVMMIVQPRSHTKEYLACLDHVRATLARARGETPEPTRDV